MKTKIRMILMSHLSDIQIELYVPERKSLIQDRLGFVKYLINKYPNLETEIDPKAEWDDYLSKLDVEVQELMSNIAGREVSTTEIEKIFGKNQLFRHGE